MSDKVYFALEVCETKKYKNIVASGCRDEANCPLVRPGPVGGVPSGEDFLRDPSPYLDEFRRKPRKTPNG